MTQERGCNPTPEPSRFGLAGGKAQKEMAERKSDKLASYGVCHGVYKAFKTKHLARTSSFVVRAYPLSSLTSGRDKVRVG